MTLLAPFGHCVMSGLSPLSGAEGKLDFETVRSVDGMLSKKLGNKRNFIKPLMRFVRSDVRDHIVS